MIGAVSKTAIPLKAGSWVRIPPPPLFRFYNTNNGYICEVRYGGKDANALQRGFWTHAKQAENYFDSLTDGWVDYSDNETLVKIFRYAFVSSQQGHDKAVEILIHDIEKLKAEKS